MWKVQSRTHIMDELAFGLRHGGQNLYPLVRRHEPALSRHRHVSCFSLGAQVKPQKHTYSAKVFSTSSTNFPLCLVKDTSSSEYVTLRFVLCVSGLMPSASARRVLRFAISHSFVQRGVRAASRPAELEAHLPHSTGC